MSSLFDAAATALRLVVFFFFFVTESYVAQADCDSLCSSA